MPPQSVHASRKPTPSPVISEGRRTNSPQAVTGRGMYSPTADAGRRTSSLPVIPGSRTPTPSVGTGKEMISTDYSSRHPNTCEGKPCQISVVKERFKSGDSVFINSDKTKLRGREIFEVFLENNDVTRDVYNTVRKDANYESINKYT